MWAIETHNLLPRSHLGGRRGTSCDHAIHDLLEQIHTGWRHGKVASLLCMDGQGAFDTVNHTRMTHNLRKRRIGGNMLEWCKSFLCNRTLHLQLGEHTSAARSIDIGIPQGSPVSPIFYIFYSLVLIEDGTIPTSMSRLRATLMRIALWPSAIPPRRTPRSWNAYTKRRLLPGPEDTQQSSPPRNINSCTSTINSCTSTHLTAGTAAILI